MHTHNPPLTAPCMPSVRHTSCDPPLLVPLKNNWVEGVPWWFRGLRIYTVTAVARVAAVGQVQSLALDLCMLGTAKRKKKKSQSTVDIDISTNGPGLQLIQGFKRKCGHSVWIEEASKQRHGNHKNETNVNPQNEEKNI